MGAKLDYSAYLENIMKKILEKINIPSKEEIDLLKKRVAKLEKTMKIDKDKKPEKTRKYTNKKRTATSIVIDIISKSPKGATFKDIQAKTDFDERKLRNIIFRLNKLNKIERIKHGRYKIT